MTMTNSSGLRLAPRLEVQSSMLVRRDHLQVIRIDAAWILAPMMQFMSVGNWFAIHLVVHAMRLLHPPLTRGNLIAWVDHSWITIRRRAPLPFPAAGVGIDDVGVGRAPDRMSVDVANWQPSNSVAGWCGGFCDGSGITAPAHAQSRRIWGFVCIPVTVNFDCQGAINAAMTSLMNWLTAIGAGMMRRLVARVRAIFPASSAARAIRCEHCSAVFTGNGGNLGLRHFLTSIPVEESATPEGGSTPLRPFAFLNFTTTEPNFGESEPPEDEDEVA